MGTRETRHGHCPKELSGTLEWTLFPPAPPRIPGRVRGQLNRARMPGKGRAEISEWSPLLCVSEPQRGLLRTSLMPSGIRESGNHWAVLAVGAVGDSRCSDVG